MFLRNITRKACDFQHFLELKNKLLAEERVIMERQCRNEKKKKK